jgi:hypothetical protein
VQLRAVDQVEALELQPITHGRADKLDEIGGGTLFEKPTVLFEGAGGFTLLQRAQCLLEKFSLGANGEFRPELRLQLRDLALVAGELNRLPAGLALKLLESGQLAGDLPGTIRAYRVVDD